MSSTIDEAESEAERLIDEGRVDEALRVLETRLQQYPASCGLWHLQGAAFGEVGRHADALRCFERCIQLHPKVFSGWYHKAVALAALGERARAIDAYRQARRLDPTDASSAFNLGVELLRIGAPPEEALEQLDEAESLGHPRARAAADVIREQLKK